MTDPFKPLGEGNGKPAKSAQTAWRAIVPVPDGAGLPPDFLFKRNQPTGQWEYRDKDGKLLGFVYRFDSTSSGKSFRPCCYCENEAGERQWRMKGWDAPRPLYGLDRLAGRPDTPVIVCEGEKAADAGAKLLPDYVVVTSPNGSKSANKADWTPLKGRKLTIWPDADEPGQRYAHAVARALLKQDGKDAVCSIIAPPKDAPTGWDAADCLEQDGGQKLAGQLLFKAVSAVEAMQKAHVSTSSTPSNSAEPDQKGGGRKRGSVKNDLIELADGCEFWHDPDKVAYATVTVNDHHENMRISSPVFERWIAGRYYHQTGGAVGDTAMKEALRVLEVKAIEGGKEYETFLRIGRAGGHIYVDLGQKQWNAVAIGPHGWELVEQAPVKFIRSPSMKPLPIPEAGELLESQLRPFVNVERESDFMLVVSWLVAAMFDSGPYPIMIVNGEQGSSKSTLAKLLRKLIDPNKAPNRSVPREERDLLVSAVNSWVLSLDNLSSVPNWLSDALCRFNSGGGYSARALHTDMDEIVVSIARPIILNGIPDLANRPDLGERAITLMLPAIPDDQRKDEQEFWSEFDQAWPFILGGLFDAVSCSLRNLPNVNLEKKPRMADFAKRIVAAESGLGWEPGEFLRIYEANQQSIVETALESDPVAQTIRDIFTYGNYPAGWAGTPTRLLNILNDKTSDSVKGRFWPKNPTAMGSALRRVQKPLSRVGYVIEKSRGAKRMISITPPSG